MKSLNVAVVLALVATLFLALLVFLAISDRVQNKYLNPVFEAMDELELQSARNALDTGGPAAVSSYMQQLNRLFGSSHYLLNSRGVDQASGENRADLLPRAPDSRSRGYVNGKLIVTHQASDKRYWFVAVDPRQTSRWTFFPYYLLVIGATCLLCWLASLPHLSFPPLYSPPPSPLFFVGVVS